MFTPTEVRFYRLNLVSIISLFLLILAGGIVRSTGSGMGCPDWPKCFDQYIPPTEVSQLPRNYKEIYVARRMAKNERFAKILDKAGYADLAQKVRDDESIRIPEEFNVANTYTEYVNRLIGAVTGVFLLLTFFYSFKLYSKRKRIFWLSLINLLLVVFQAWLGSIVVSTNLLAWMITIHMLVAILILAIAIFTYFDVKNLYFIQKYSNPFWLFTLKTISIISLLFTVIQVEVGTEVRETIDMVKSKFPELERGEWLYEVGRVFLDHRNWALVVLLLNLIVIGITWLKFKDLRVYATWIGLTIGIQLFTGIILSNYNLAPWAQALHVLFAVMMFSAQFYLFLHLRNYKAELHNN